MGSAGGGPSRRAVLMAGAAVAGALGMSGRAAADFGVPRDPGAAVVPCWGEHQAGVDTRLQSFARLVALDLRPDTGAAALARLMRLWTDDIERLTQGTAALADPAPELAGTPARLTVTVGYGPGVFQLPGLRRRAPHWLEPLPGFAVDRLQRQWTGGDLVLQVAADDPLAVAHAVHVLLRDADAFAVVRWQQSGFHRAAGMTVAGSTGRNLMGQVDGTVNPVAGTDDFGAVVWDGGDRWWAGGTGMVVRRISMDLAAWSGVDRASQEMAIGRRLADGAPLTGGTERDAPDLTATDADGMLLIPEFAHIRRAAPGADHERILRRPFNYDDGDDSGLIFVAFAADPVRQFVPIQARLAELDLLNTWTTAIGSAVALVLPGFHRGDWLGSALLG